ncbi:MAG TPA: hypothetical protein VEG60_25475 [Candidatus Binatia bacterium]|nr:hypothetical protein [Candidatus Binatia bacterium]
MKQGLIPTIACYILWLLLIAGCDSKVSPSAEQAEKALSQAQSGVDQAAKSIGAMRNRSEQLQQKIDHQRSELTALIEKRLALLHQQLADYEQRVERLPASKETVLKPGLADLEKRLTGLAESFRAYRDAPPEKSTASLEQLEESLKNFSKAQQKLYSEIQQS